MLKKLVIIAVVLVLAGAYVWYNVPLVEVTSGMNSSRRTMDQYMKWRADQKRCLKEFCPIPLSQ